MSDTGKEDDNAHWRLPQQHAWDGYTPLRRQPAAQHGQKATETEPLLKPSRSFTPRPGH